jgi:transglutaminase-like putative cysteine protease
MTVVKWDTRLTKKYPAVFEYSQSYFVDKLVTYIINSKYRTAVSLKHWIKEQVDMPTLDLTTLAFSLKDADDDKTIYNICMWVKKNVKYVSDTDNWQMAERWQTASETLFMREGDCEDGSILMYVLARINGIAPARVMLFCGSVVNPNGGTFGHCWFGYKPWAYPTNWMFFDWCYFPDVQQTQSRRVYYVYDKEIVEYKPVLHGYTRQKSNYLKMWFAFNENFSYVDMRTI